MKAALKYIGLLLLILLVTGSIYEEIGRRRDRARIPQVGASVNIGGRSLNIMCSGMGRPAVIIETGNNEPGYAWSHIQHELAKFTLSCWYDRAGYGWSDLGPFPRSSGATADDLHELLHRASVPEPYVLVGHSLGGLDARVYNGRYPSEVAGAVLVESAHEDEPKRAPKAYLGRTIPSAYWRVLHIAVRTVARVGLIRLFTPAPQLAADPAQRTREQIVEALKRTPTQIATVAADATSPESYAQAHAAGGFGDKPLIVLTRGEPVAAGTDPEEAAYEHVWRHEIQTSLTKLSTHGRQIFAEKSGHMIPETEPQLVIDAVREVVSAVRARPQTASPR